MLGGCCYSNWPSYVSPQSLGYRSFGFSYVLSRCFFWMFCRCRAFVIWLSQISTFFSSRYDSHLQKGEVKCAQMNMKLMTSQLGSAVDNRSLGELFFWIWAFVFVHLLHNWKQGLGSVIWLTKHVLCLWIHHLIVNSVYNHFVFICVVQLYWWLCCVVFGGWCGGFCHITVRARPHPFYPTYLIGDWYNWLCIVISLIG